MWRCSLVGHAGGPQGHSRKRLTDTDSRATVPDRNNLRNLTQREGNSYLTHEAGRKASGPKLFVAGLLHSLDGLDVLVLEIAEALFHKYPRIFGSSCKGFLSTSSLTWVVPASLICCRNFLPSRSRQSWRSQSRVSTAAWRTISLPFRGQLFSRPGRKSAAARKRRYGR